MSGFNGIKKVMLAIETNSGESHMLIVEEPGLSGGNPAFMSQQFEAGLADLSERGHALIAAVYGKQIRVESS